jgi:hypothetical protein
MTEEISQATKISFRSQQEACTTNLAAFSAAGIGHREGLSLPVLFPLTGY